MTTKAAARTKFCPRCGEDKPLNAFWSNRARTDGKQDYCSECSGSYKSAKHRGEQPPPSIAAFGRRGPGSHQYRRRSSVWSEDGKKRCSLCGEFKGSDGYYGGFHYPRSCCKDCQRVSHQLKKYSLSLEQFNEMLHRQEGKCPICHVLLIGKNLHVDHDHLSGTVRGLLCFNCNVGLGNFADNISRLETAATYLRKNVASLKGGG